jgi:hypothetical protein
MSDTPTKFKCKHCNKYLSAKRRLNEHIDICKDNPKFEQVRCKYCDYTGRKDNVKRHEETMCKERKRLVILEKKLQQVIEEKDRLKDKLLEEKDKRLGDKEDTIKSKDETISAYKKSQKDYVRLSGSIIKFLMKHFNDAPELTFDVNEFEFNRDVMAGILNDDSRKHLVNYASELIIKHYKKADPKLQSLWGIDKNRLHYVNRQKDDDDNITWTDDNYGEFVKRRIIKPLIRSISNHCVDNIDDIIESQFMSIENEDEKVRKHEISMLQQKAYLIESPSVLDELTIAVFKKVSKNFIFDRTLIKKYTTVED